MCEIEKLLREEGMIIGYVETMRRHGASDDEIMKKIMDRFGLRDCEADSFVQGTKEKVNV